MKKFKFLTISILLALGIFTIFSCAKDNEQNPSTAAKSTYDSSNPFLFVGDAHNNILDYIAYHAGTDSLTDNTIFLLTKDYMSEFHNYTWASSFEDFINLQQAADILSTSMMNNNVPTTMVFEDEDLQKIFNDLFTLLNNIISRESLLDETQFIDSITLLEKKVSYSIPDMINSRELTSEQEIVLASLSIAKSSYCYWLNAINGNNDFWSYTYSDDNVKKPRPLKLIKDIACTVAKDVCAFAESANEHTVVRYDPIDSSVIERRTDLLASIADAGAASSDEWENRRK